jgi:hypothetical protein
MGAAPVFSTTVRSVPVGGANPRDKSMDNPVASKAPAWIAGVPGDENRKAPGGRVTVTT